MSEDDYRDRSATPQLDRLLRAMYADFRDQATRDELTQQAMPLVESAYQWFRAWIDEGSSLNLYGRLAVLVDLLPEPSPDFQPSPALTAGLRAAIDHKVAAMAARGNVALSPLQAAGEGVVTPAGPETAWDYRLRLTGWILGIVIMWLVVLLGPAAIQDSHLSAETQQTLNDYYGLLAAIALAVTGYIFARKIAPEPRDRKRQ
jgi:hypothetical protein